MTSTLAGLGSSLLGLVLLAVVVYVGLRVAQSVFSTNTKKAAATEVAAKLVAYPTGSAGVLRRRFVRALTSQHVIMPSGERHAYSELTVRVAPEDLERLDPDGDTDRLGADAAKAYLTHARREGWTAPQDATVVVEVDPGLRSGWVPPARGTGRAAGREGLGWDVVKADEPTPLRVVPARHDPDATVGFSAITSQPDDAAPTMNVSGDLCLERDGEVVVVPRDATTTTLLGRLPASPITFDEREVSYRHAALRLRAGRWQLKDLGSTNGTSVDGERVEPDAWTPLRSGAVIALAGVRLMAATGTTGTVNLESLTSR